MFPVTGLPILFVAALGDIAVVFLSFLFEFIQIFIVPQVN